MSITGKIDKYLVNEGKFTGVKYNDAHDTYELWVDGKVAETVKKKVYDTKMSSIQKKWMQKYKTLQTLKYNWEHDIKLEK